MDHRQADAWLFFLDVQDLAGERAHALIVEDQVAFFVIGLEGGLAVELVDVIEAEALHPALGEEEDAVLRGLFDRLGQGLGFILDVLELGLEVLFLDVEDLDMKARAQLLELLGQVLDLFDDLALGGCLEMGQLVVGGLADGGSIAEVNDDVGLAAQLLEVVPDAFVDREQVVAGPIETLVMVKGKGIDACHEHQGQRDLQGHVGAHGAALRQDRPHEAFQLNDHGQKEQGGARQGDDQPLFLDIDGQPQDQAGDDSHQSGQARPDASRKDPLEFLVTAIDDSPGCEPSKRDKTTRPRHTAPVGGYRPGRG